MSSSTPAPITKNTTHTKLGGVRRLLLTLSLGWEVWRLWRATAGDGRDLGARLEMLATSSDPKVQERLATVARRLDLLLGGE